MLYNKARKLVDLINDSESVFGNKGAFYFSELNAKAVLDDQYSSNFSVYVAGNSNIESTANNCQDLFYNYDAVLYCLLTNSDGMQNALMRLLKYIQMLDGELETFTTDAGRIYREIFNDVLTNDVCIIRINFSLSEAITHSYCTACIGSKCNNCKCQ